MNESTKGHRKNANWINIQQTEEEPLHKAHKT